MRISLRNGNGHPVHMGVTQWKITRVFSEHDEALINRRLPRELLLRVFSYLDIISLCRSAQVRKSNLCLVFLILIFQFFR